MIVNKKQRKLILRTTPYPSQSDLQPFINSHEKLTNGEDVDKNTPAQMDPLSSLVPINKETIRLGELYREELAGLLGSKIEVTRKFFLEQVAPYLLACSNGLQDARDVMQHAFGEEADVVPLFNKIENAVGLAMDVRILHFAKELTGLNQAEARQFMMLALSKELGSNDDLADKLLKMLPRQSRDEQKEVGQPRTQRKLVRKTANVKRRQA